jgi:lipid II:glycine glycyltransferase (peptidoglycan interpeptide bridge formation enzyme)
VLDLREGFESIVENCFTPSCRRAIRKAQRNKVEITPLEAEDYLESFLGLYDRSMRRWGLSKGFPAKLFELLWATPGVRYWGALHQGQLVSAALIVSHGKRQYYWLGVMDETASEVRPNNLLFHEILKESCRQGIETFDLGNSEGLIGVFNFKKSFGPAVETYPMLYRAGTLIRGLRRLRSFLRG